MFVCQMLAILSRPQCVNTRDVTDEESMRLRNIEVQSTVLVLFVFSLGYESKCNLIRFFFLLVVLRI